jgi:hypothetical protein
MYGAPYVPAGSLGLPFVPFTFPTVLFCNMAERLGYTMSWSDADRVWKIFSEGMDDGALSVDDRGVVQSNKFVDYVMSRGVDRDLAVKWLGAAQEAAVEWWGQGSYFRHFGGSSGVLGAAGGVVQGAAEAVKAAGDAVVGGIARAVGVPRWLLTVLVGLAVVAVVAVIVRAYFPRALRAA